MNTNFWKLTAQIIVIILFLIVGIGVGLFASNKYYTVRIDKLQTYYVDKIDSLARIPKETHNQTMTIQKQKVKNSTQKNSPDYGTRKKTN